MREKAFISRIPKNHTRKSVSKTAYAITIQDIFETTENVPKKNDLRVWEYSIYIEPANDKSHIIKQKYIPLDIPTNVYKVLEAINKIEEVIKGNNITSDPNQYAFLVNCFEG